jgi:hypothetical protein
LPIVILVTGIVPLQTDALTFLAFFLPYFIVTTLACDEMARGHVRFGESAVYNLARAPASIVAALTAHRERNFRVTPKTRAPRRRLPETMFAYAFLLATLGAIAYACGAALAGRSPLPASTLAIVVAWAAYHVITALRLLLLENRCARDRRATTRFDENVEATLTPSGDPRGHYAVRAVAVSADGLTLQTQKDAPNPPAGDYHCVLEVADAPVSCRLTVREGGLGGAVKWPDQAARTAFDLLLHQRAIERFAAADRGDLGGLLRPAFRVDHWRIFRWRRSLRAARRRST